MSSLDSTVIIDTEGEGLVSPEVLQNAAHSAKLSVDVERRDVYFEFKSRRALYDFAKSLLFEAIHGKSDLVECFPLVEEGGTSHVVNGVRLSEDSSRLFISLPEDPNQSLQRTATSRRL